jgi:hypothetical protein
MEFFDILGATHLLFRRLEISTANKNKTGFFEYIFRKMWAKVNSFQTLWLESMVYCLKDPPSKF